MKGRIASLPLNQLTIFLSYIAVLSLMKKVERGTRMKKTITRDVIRSMSQHESHTTMNKRSMMSQKTCMVDLLHDK